MNNGEEYFESWTYSTKMYKASYKKKKKIAVVVPMT